MAYANRSWALVKCSASESIDFSQLIQPDYASTRKNVVLDPCTEVMVKWDGAEPATIGSLRSAGDLITYNGNDVHNHAEILAILADTGSWSPPTDI